MVGKRIECWGKHEERGRGGASVARDWMTGYRSLPRLHRGGVDFDRSAAGNSFGSGRVTLPMAARLVPR